MFSVTRSAALSAAVLVGMGLTASAATVNTVTFQDGTPAPFTAGNYDGTQDATLYWGGDSQFNTGTSPVVFTSGVNSHIVMQFDVSSLAGKGAIQSAKLVLMPENSSGAAFSSTFSVYQLADANAGWQQGSKSYAQATTGEVTWDYKAYNTVEWAGATPGPYDPNTDPAHGNRGASNAGVDYLTPALGTGTYVQVPSHAPVEGDQVSVDLPGSLIDHWLSGTNAGLIIIADGTTAQGEQFVSSDSYYEPSTWKPALQVTYAVPEPASAALLLVGGGLVTLRRRRN
jgi:hypothetical protein